MNEEKRIGIIGAMEEEVRTLISAMEEHQTEEVSGLVFHLGTLGGVPCAVVQCGPGKVNAAVCAQTLALRYNPRLLINVGVAGGVGEDIHIGDLVVASACVQHDFDTTATGDPLGTLFLRRSEQKEDILELPCDRAASAVLEREAESIYGGAHFGIVATGDLFVADGAKSEEIGRLFSAKAVEMEGGSIAQVCYMNRLPCVVLRAISDNANEKSHVDFPTFVHMAAEKTALLLQRCIAKL